MSVIQNNFSYNVTDNLCKSLANYLYGKFYGLMRQRLRLLAFFAMFWILFQVALRAIFMVYNHDLTQQLTGSEIVLVFWNGLKMDFSMGGYFLMFTSLILTISVFTQSRYLFLILNAISIIGLLFSSVIMMVDLELYRHWGFRVDTTPLFYMTGTEEEAMGSVEISVAIKLLFILAATFSIALFLYSVWLMPKLGTLMPSSRKAAVIMLVVTALLFIPVRGSFTVAPMNTGFVYFHQTKVFANHAAINVVWNFMKSVTKSGPVKYPKNFFDGEKTEAYFKELYTSTDSTTKIFTIEKPNIILFILESFTADVVAPLGGVPDLTPNLNQLCTEGILFDNFYASGDRTDKGVISILSGYPAQPITSIIKFPSKTQRLSYLNHSIRDLGYQTSFTYGGDVDFANFRSYLTMSRFDHITTHEDFPAEDESKWGVHDHILFQQALKECDTASAPFFKVILSLSSHEPFDVPMAPYIKEVSDEALFLNSCHYTDKSLGEFMTKAKQSSWWKNSVIIFVADHGHRSPGNKSLQSKERFRIPFLMVGGAIKGDSIIHTFGNQTDIAATLLGQLGLSNTNFKFSKNLFAKDVKSFSNYFFNNGYGFVAPEKYIVYDNTSNQFLQKEGVTENDLNQSKAYQQMLYLDYNSK
jgi:phosphoglycerol transferase MdoB-like AlkP superfamily enzyme